VDRSNEVIAEETFELKTKGCPDSNTLKASVDSFGPDD